MYGAWFQGYTSDADTLRRKSIRKAAENVCHATSVLASDILEVFVYFFYSIGMGYT